MYRNLVLLLLLHVYIVYIYIYIYIYMCLYYVCIRARTRRATPRQRRALRGVRAQREPRGMNKRKPFAGNGNG